MMKRVAIWIAAAAMAAAAWGGSAAEEVVPRAVVYQGVLSDPVEGPLEGAQKVSFRVFEDAAGGNPAWNTNLDVWCGTGGAFHAWLEDGDDLVDAFSGPQRFLEMQVDGHGDAIAPRIAFTSVPQAVLARYARLSPLSFAVAGDLSVSNTLAVADGVHFDAGASFGGLTVEGGAEWMDTNMPVTVSGTVEAERFEGDGIPPVGSIAMWMDPDPENIPPGWALCNGQVTNGITTPDLTDRFPVGAGGQEFNYAVGTTGGMDSVTLEVKHIPSHSHKYTTASTRNYHPKPWMGWMDGDWWQNGTDGNYASSNTVFAGNGKAHENRPPYLAVYFIMRVE